MHTIYYLSLEQSSNDEEIDHDLIWAQLLSFRDSGYDKHTSMVGGWGVIMLQLCHSFKIIEEAQILHELKVM